MRSITRHFIACVVCVTVFCLTGALDGFVNILRNPRADSRAVLALSALVYFIIVCAFCVLVLTPVTSIANYLFTYKWPLSVYGQAPLLIPLLVLYLFPWTLYFGRSFPSILLAGSLSLTLPLLLYWAIFKTLDRDFV